MPINLSQPQEPQQNIFHKKRQLVDTGILISCAVAIITGLIFGGLKFYNMNLNKKIEDIGAKIQNDAVYLNGSPKKDADVDKVADFQKRLAKVNENISSRRNPKEVLDQLEKLIVGGVVLDSFACDQVKKSVKLVAQSDNFFAIARQLLSFKKSDYFSDVKISNVQRTETAKISFAIEMNIVK